MVRKIEAEIVSGDRLELVRNGYDPYQVQRLVSTLATELKALVAENDALRARITDAPVRSRDANGDFIERRSRGNTAAIIAENEKLRDNLRFARSALDTLLNHLSTKSGAGSQQAESSSR